MKNIKIYLENGQVIITSAVAASSKLNSSINNAPAVNTYPSNEALTASIVNTNQIKVVNSNGTVVLNNIPFAKLVGKDGTTAIGASAAAVLSTLNSTSYFAATPIDPKVATNTSLITAEAAKVTALKAATKTDSGDRGVFVNDGKATTSSHVSVKTSDSTLQAGSHTAIKLNEVGSATLTLSVQAGTTGNKSSVDAITVLGNTNGATALTTFNEAVDFDGSVTGLTSAAIPNLAASKITSGTFTTTRIPSLNASKLGSGTLTDARVAVSNVTQHEASLSITESQISDLSHYTNASVDTHLNQSGASSGQYLKWTGTDYAWGTVSSGGLGNIVEDTSPQLGGNLDVDGNEIQSTGNVVVRVDSDNNTSLSKFVVKNGAGTDIYSIDEEGTTIATTGASSNIKIGNLDGGLSSFNGISLNNDLTYPGIVGFAGGSSSNDNFFCFGVVLDFRPDGVAGGLRMVKDSSGNAMVTINKGDSSTAPTTHTFYVGGNAKFDDNVDFASGIDVTGNITVTGTVDGIDIGTDVAANTAKTSFPGFGTTAGTALEGNTSFTNTNLGNTDMTLSGSRIVTMGHDLNFKVGSSSKLLYDTSANSGFGLWQFSAPTQFLHDVKFNGAGGTTQASIKFNEPSMGGTNGVILQGPSTNMTSDLTFTLPDTDGTNGQYLTTDGSGILSFATASGGVTVNTQAANRLVACSSSTDVLDGEANLTFNGSTLSVTGAVTTTGQLSGNGSSIAVSKIETSIGGASSAGDLGLNAEVVTITTTTGLNAGYVYYLGASAWTSAVATSVAAASGMMGVATGTSSADGMCIRGIVCVATALGGSIGDVVYLSTATGRMTTTAVSSTGNVNRVMGYKVASYKMFFNPSQEWIEIS